MTHETATAIATIDLGALRHNVRQLAAKAAPASLMGVVKADAYGHGAFRVAEVLLSEGVHWLAVATVKEGTALRRAGIQCPILVMAAMQPEWLEWFVDFDLDATIVSAETVDALAAMSKPVDPLRVHIKIDTGMGRIGLNPGDTEKVAGQLERLDWTEITGFFTHLASADADDLASAKEQVDRFERALRGVNTEGRVIHIANTEAVARLPESFSVHPDSLVRTGVGLYGSPVRDDTRSDLDLRQVMTLSAAVVQAKTVSAGTPISYGGRWRAKEETQIATLGIGYADGYRRILEGRAWTGINGLQCEIVGAICMDMIMAALPAGAEPVKTGTRAVLLGDGGPHVADVARWAETIPYEIWTGIGTRIPRVYNDLDSADV